MTEKCCQEKKGEGEKEEKRKWEKKEKRRQTKEKRKREIIKGNVMIKLYKIFQLIYYDFIFEIWWQQ